MTEEVRSLKAFAIGAPMIGAIVFFLFGVSYLISLLLGLPTSLAVPIPVRVIGGAFVLAGLGVLGWTFRTRNPVSVITSTYITLTKALRGIPRTERGGRTEPLVVSGPQRYTRNPLYFGVFVFVLGWALLTATTFLFVATLVILLWFAGLIIPFEERELKALFGEEWDRYSEETPMLFPFTKRKKRFAS